MQKQGPIKPVESIELSGDEISGMCEGIPEECGILPYRKYQACPTLRMNRRVNPGKFPSNEAAGAADRFACWLRESCLNMAI